MANNVPDEILSEILSPALRVSDVAFSTLSVAGASPFMSFSESSSAYLVVSKAWLRVATPLLYNIVVIRSKAQAQALAATLTANPDLGRFIKKLRVEGGFASSMYKILASSRSITDIFLSLAISPSDNACGLCRGLPLLDPCRLIIDTGDWYWWGAAKNAQKLVDTLEKCIPTWKRLAHVEMPHNLGNRSTISSALSQAPNLDTLVVWDPQNWMNRIHPYIRTISTNSALKHIQIKPTVLPTHYEYPRRKALYDEVQNDTKLKALWDFKGERYLISHLQVTGLTYPVSSIPTDDEIPSGAIEPPSSPFVYPARLAADPMAEDAIWARVLSFALRDVSSERKRQFLQSDRWDPDQDDDDLSDSAPSRLAPLLVCKKFARLGVPHLFESPVLKHAWAVESFASQLAQQPLLGRRVRCLSINHGSDAAMFKRIIAQTPGLTELRGGPGCRPMTWKAFSDLSKSSGSSLRSFGGIPISKASGAVDPDIFALFSNMQYFGWDTLTGIKTQPKLISTDALSLLVDLTVDRFDGSFLDVLAQMELPSLRTVVFPATARGDGAQFFQKHGTKLQELTLSERQIEDPELAIWRNCPSITVLGVCYDKQHPVRSSCLKTSETHPRLERIVFTVKEYQRLTQPQRIELGQLMTALRSTASFPALREIQHPCCTWPTTEHEIKISHWVKWAESLLERDVHLFGPKGVRWRPRLKFVTKNKQ